VPPVSNFTCESFVLMIVSLAAGALLFDAQPVIACDCHGGGPVCEDFWKTPVVFVGHVEAVNAAARGCRNFKLSLITGARIGELLDLRWEDCQDTFNLST